MQHPFKLTSSPIVSISVIAISTATESPCCSLMKAANSSNLKIMSQKDENVEIALFLELQYDISLRLTNMT